MRLLLVLLGFVALLVLTSSSGQQGDKSLAFDYSAGKLEESVQAGMPTVVELAASWCTECLTMAPVVKQLKREYEDRVTILVADITTAADLTRGNQVMGVPAFLLFDAEGQTVRMLIGYKDEATMRRLLDSLARTQAATQPPSANSTTAAASTGSAEAPQGSPFSAPAGIPKELRIEDVRWEGKQVVLTVVLWLDQIVRSRTLTVSLQGKLLEVVNTSPDISSPQADDSVFISAGEPVTVVCEAEHGVDESGLLEVQLAIKEQGG